MSSIKKRPQDITSAERIIRVQEVYNMILQGATRQQILRYCAGSFNVKERVCDDYLSEAKQLLKENFAKTEDADLMKSEIYARYELLYKQSFDVDDFRECRNILKSITDLLGISQPAKLDITTKGESINSTPQIVFTKQSDED